MFQLAENGYITKYLYSGKEVMKLDVDSQDICKEKNQLRYEKQLRGGIKQNDSIYPEEKIRLGDNSQLGMPWQYYYSHGNVFLDTSSFYLELHKIQLLAATELVSPEEAEVELCIWSYDAVTLWINKTLAGKIETPVYKPIQQVKIKTKLQKGRSLLFVWLGTLGVRDTRVGFAIQVLSSTQKIAVSLPDTGGTAPYTAAANLLDSARLKDGRIFLGSGVPQGSYLSYNKENPDFYKREANDIRQDIAGQQEIRLKDYASLSLVIPVGNSMMKRNLERIELRKPDYSKNKQDILTEIAGVTSMTRSRTDGFALYPMLARLQLGISGKEDEEQFMITLSQIERRVDCSDFMTCALVRICKKYPVGEEARREMKRVMLSFRYWMDEEGQDAMCFWSENHSLMFYQTAYFFGQEYPDDIFVRSGKTGVELYRNAQSRLLEWLTDVCEQGFDEFNSGVYSAITLAALLNLVDFAEKPIAELASKAADILVRAAALHCFHKVIISPQGRIYRDVIYPGRQGLQGLIHYADADAPYVFNEWLAAISDSTYELPEDFRLLMNKEGAFSYRSSNGIIDLYKTASYMLTSVQSPVREALSRIWEADMTEEHRERFLYTKSLNECFHGTTQFEPGVLGYQQHMWYAALDPDLVVFTNHPGSTCEDVAECRPGYWFGNGIMPALRQENNILGIVYMIPDTQPVKFTHVFWPEEKFDETYREGGWLFGRKSGSYIALWCNVPMTDHDDMLFDCEKRNYSEKTAYLCILGEEREQGDFSSFMEECIRRDVVFCQEAGTLSCREFQLVFEPHHNPSQYIA